MLEWDERMPRWAAGVDPQTRGTWPWELAFSRVLVLWAEGAALIESLPMYAAT